MPECHHEGVRTCSGAECHLPGGGVAASITAGVSTPCAEADVHGGGQELERASSAGPERRGTGRGIGRRCPGRAGRGGALAAGLRAQHPQVVPQEEGPLLPQAQEVQEEQEEQEEQGEEGVGGRGGGEAGRREGAGEGLSLGPEEGRPPRQREGQGHGREEGGEVNARRYSEAQEGGSEGDVGGEEGRKEGEFTHAVRFPQGSVSTGNVSQGATCPTKN